MRKYNKEKLPIGAHVDFTKQGSLFKAVMTVREHGFRAFRWIDKNTSRAEVLYDMNCEYLAFSLANGINEEKKKRKR